jgi:hypothetical protein
MLTFIEGNNCSLFTVMVITFNMFLTSFCEHRLVITAFCLWLHLTCFINRSVDIDNCVLMIIFYMFLASFCGQPLLCIVDDYILHVSCIILWTTITVHCWWLHFTFSLHHYVDNHYCVLLMITFYIFLVSFCGQPLLCIVDDYILHFSCIILWRTITVYCWWLHFTFFLHHSVDNHYCVLLMITFYMFLASFCGQPLLCIVDDYILHCPCIILWTTNTVYCWWLHFTFFLYHSVDNHYCVVLMITFYIFLASFCGQPLLCIVDDYILHFPCIILWTTITVYCWLLHLRWKLCHFLK